MGYRRATTPMTRTDSAQFATLALNDGELYVYDPDTPKAWIQSSDPVTLQDWR